MENVQDVYRLTPVQEGILSHAIFEPNSDNYVQQFVCRLSGNVDEDKLKAAWESVVQRHPALRTIFLWEEIDEPLQVVRETVSLDWTVEDWRSLAASERSQRWRQWLTADRERGFELAAAPPSRVALVRQGDEQWRFVWSFHHLLLDGWSTSIVIREVLDLYGNGHSNPSRESEKLSVRQYLEWLQSKSLNDCKSFWKNELSGFHSPTQLDLIDDRVESSSGTSVSRCDILLDRAIYDGLASLARNSRVTLSIVVHAAWALVLSRFSGSHDVVFGSTVSGRSAELPAAETMVGCCINTLPLRVRFSQNISVREWLQTIQRHHVKIREQVFVPLATIQSCSDLPARIPLFDSLIAFENYPEPLTAISTTALRISEIDVIEQSSFPIAVLAIPENGSLRVRLIRNGESVSDAATARIAEHFKSALTQLTGAADQTVDQVCGLPANESERLDRFSLGPNPHPPSAATILDAIPFNADAVAVVDKDETLTYRELEHRANALANVLLDRGVVAGDRVGICMHRSSDIVVASLGVMKAGGAYVPLDPDYPIDRLAFITKDAGCRFVVASEACQSLFADVATIPPNVISGKKDALPDRVETAHEPTALAYLIYTSGSTGKPKGVAVTHQCLLHSTFARHQHYSESVGRFLLLSSMSFDSSVAGLFWTLTCGGTLVLPESGQEKDLKSIAGLIETHQVTHTLCLPSLYGLLLQWAETSQLKTLRVVTVAGEECSHRLCSRHWEQLPECELHNEYGPTEATVWATAWQCVQHPQRHTIPIGKPIPGTRVRILDRQDRQTPIGVAGEICLGGAGIASGYWNDPTATQQKFIQSPIDPQERLYRTGDLGYWQHDGTIVFRGRVDRQVKIRGHRIELTEIESALTEFSSVEEAIVMTENQLITADVESLVNSLQGLEEEQIDQLLSEVTGS